jgi:maleamate amidohydrolase
VPREAVGDRNPAAHDANLYDIDAKYGDVVSVDEVIEHLKALAPEEVGAR